MLTNDGVNVHLSTGMGGTGGKGSLRVRWWWKSLITGGEEDDHDHRFLDSRSRLVRRARGDGVVKPDGMIPSATERAVMSGQPSLRLSARGARPGPAGDQMAWSLAPPPSRTDSPD